MAAFFEREDDARPDEVTERRREAARRLAAAGFSRPEIEALYGNVLTVGKPA